MSEPALEHPVPELDELSPVRSVLTWIPPLYEIPPAQRVVGSDYWQLVRRWHDRGLPAGTVFYAREGVDAFEARRAIKRLLEDELVKHWHKYAAAAYLMDCWFESVEGWEET